MCMLSSSSKNNEDFEYCKDDRTREIILEWMVREAFTAERRLDQGSEG